MSASSYCSRQVELTIDFRKVRSPSVALYQAGRGNEPMIDVGSMVPAEALYMGSLPRQRRDAPCVFLSSHATVTGTRRRYQVRRLEHWLGIVFLPCDGALGTVV